MKTLYQEARHFSRTAKGMLKMIDRVALIDKPWTDRNVRTYQRLWCQAEQNRWRIIKLYLNQRKTRA